MLFHSQEVKWIGNTTLGTRYFDDNWFFSGVGERKLTHIMDFIDSAIYLKQKGIA